MRVYCKKAHRPNYSPVSEHIQEMWIGTHAVVKKGVWPLVTYIEAEAPLPTDSEILLADHRSNREACDPLSLGGARQNPGITSDVTTIEALPMTKTMHDNLDYIFRDLMNYETYSLLDANNYVEGMSKCQR